jgi:hypothetical protein
MFKKKKTVMKADYGLILSAFGGNIYNIKGEYQGNLAWIELSPLEFIGIAKELLPQKKRIIFHYDENYHDNHMFLFVKDGVEYVYNVKKWIKVKA